MKMKKLISLVSISSFLLQVLIFPLPALADEKITTLDKGEAAPYAGTLFNTEAAARLITQLEFNKDVCKVEKEKELELQRVDLQLQIDLCKVSLTSCQDLCTSRIEIKDEQLIFLQTELSKRKNVHPAWMFVGGVIAGSLVALGSAYGYSQIASR